ncbi:hypothetical protein [uncultured Sphaerochaeta sp.]|uniref:hypothetical protein n=1 Tax=uncultured Sphaerochaeta sp. TaxID=886478 RepID=UPI002A0A8419|nr:hypothetical protein [uncultured Sphaerochaeta sp.]
MRDAPDRDGVYKLSYYQDGELKQKDYGYFTNGFALEDLTITDDACTVLETN